MDTMVAMDRGSGKGTGMDEPGGVEALAPVGRSVLHNPYGYLVARRNSCVRNHNSARCATRKETRHTCRKLTPLQ